MTNEDRIRKFGFYTPANNNLTYSGQVLKDEIGWTVTLIEGMRNACKGLFRKPELMCT